MYMVIHFNQGFDANIFKLKCFNVFVFVYVWPVQVEPFIYLQSLGGGGGWGLSTYSGCRVRVLLKCGHVKKIRSEFR